MPSHQHQNKTNLEMSEDPLESSLSDDDTITCQLQADSPFPLLSLNNAYIFRPAQFEPEIPFFPSKNIEPTPCSITLCYTPA
jgi:hypothetical protein